MMEMQKKYHPITLGNNDFSEILIGKKVLIMSTVHTPNAHGSEVSPRKHDEIISSWRLGIMNAWTAVSLRIQLAQSRKLFQR